MPLRPEWLDEDLGAVLGYDAEGIGTVWVFDFDHPEEATAARAHEYDEPEGCDMPEDEEQQGVQDDEPKLPRLAYLVIKPNGAEIWTRNGIKEAKALLGAQIDLFS